MPSDELEEKVFVSVSFRGRVSWSKHLTFQERYEANLIIMSQDDGSFYVRKDRYGVYYNDPVISCDAAFQLVIYHLEKFVETMKSSTG